MTRRITYENNFENAKAIEGLSTKLMWSRGTIINNEHQFYYDPLWAKGSPFRFENGRMAIRAEITPDNLKDTGMPYVSGVLTSHPHQVGKGFTQKYGRWEIRAKLPNARGVWPAFWLLPNNWDLLKGSGQNVLPEIDIMEAVAKANEGVFHATAHSRGKNVRANLKANGTVVNTKTDLTSAFHRYGFEWNPTWMIWYFDGREVKRMRTPDDMHDERHWILNVAVGGWGGTPVAADYPADFVIDYVRVWEPIYDEVISEEPEDGPVPDDTVVSPVDMSPQPDSPPEDDPVILQLRQSQVDAFLNFLRNLG